MNIPTVDIWTRPTEEAALNQIVARDFEDMFEERLQTRQVFNCQKCEIVTVNLKRQHISLTANDLLARWDGQEPLVDFLEQFTWQ